MVLNIKAKIVLTMLGIAFMVILGMTVLSWVVFDQKVLQILGQNQQSLAAVSEILKNARLLLVGSAIILLFASLIIALLFMRRLVHPVTYLNECLTVIEKGILPDNIKVLSNDEFGDIAFKLNSVVTHLRETAWYAKDIGKGKYNEDFAALSEDDELRNALINMTIALREADKREKERTWIVNGLAEIGEVLRSSNNLEVLSNDIIKYMISKISAIQGAFYVMRDNELHMAAVYAYNRKKYLQQTFALGEGLVGQSAIEMATVLRTEIPADYETITSGILGDKKPTCILICPLIIDEMVYGTVEFAGFHIFSPNEIRFVEEVGPIIARTIFNIQVAERTQKHLEESQRMSAELQQQQEELRQNAEEMQATQEELKTSNHKLEEQIEEVNRAQKRMQSLLEKASEVITIYGKDGKIKYVSPSVTNILGQNESELIGKKEDANVHDEDRAVFIDAFTELLLNPDKSVTIQYRYKKEGGEWIWLEAMGRNMLTDSAVNGIVMNCRDITLKRKAEIEERMRKNMQALSENSPDLITRISCDGQIAYTNPMIETYTGLRPSDIINQSLENITLGNGIVTSWKEILKDAKEKNDKFSLELNYHAPIGERIMQVNVIPEYGNDMMESVLVVSHDITERKLIELEIQSKNRNINESINYSRRIQNAIIPDTKLIQKSFPESFILYKPRDVVSGDFPWYLEKGENIFLSVVDCTGHGVPGAMLSLVGYFQLNNIVDLHYSLNAGMILDELDNKVNQTLIKDTKDENIKDGMDIAFCKINPSKKTVEFAGAHRPLYHLSNGEIIEYKGDKWAIGGGVYKNQTTFTNHSVKLKKGESIYFFSDGYPDQFGGPQGRKIGTARIKEVILKNQDKSMEEMNEIFLSEFENWKGDGKQTDDVLLIGIRF